MASSGTAVLSNHAKIIYGFHNAKGVADDTADSTAVETGLIDLYPILREPMSKIVGDVQTAMVTAYAKTRNDDATLYRVFMQMGKNVVWITFQNDETVKCTNAGCKDKSPTCYVKRGGFGNPCTGCGGRIPGADVVASVLNAYVVNAASDGNPSSVVAPIGDTRPAMLNIGTPEIDQYDGFLAAGTTEKTMPFTGLAVLQNIVAFMPWLSAIGHIAAKPDILPIYGVEEEKLTAYGKEIAKKIKPGDDAGTAWKSDSGGDGGNYYGLMMVRMTSMTS